MNIDSVFSTLDYINICVKHVYLYKSQVTNSLLDSELC